MKITLSYFRKVYQDFVDEKITMSKMVELLNQRVESTFSIDQDEFNEKAQHILDTVVIPQVDKYEQRKLIEQMMAQDQEDCMILNYIILDRMMGLYDMMDEAMATRIRG
jgi:ABC-type transport system involved in Fe-S cluster assembly fused permease/ATPase subunit